VAAVHQAPLQVILALADRALLQLVVRLPSVAQVPQVDRVLLVDRALLVDQVPQVDQVLLVDRVPSALAALARVARSFRRRGPACPFKTRPMRIRRSRSRATR